MTNTGGHPAANGQDDPEVHWAVRRWVSDFDGRRADQRPVEQRRCSGDGTVGRIFVDGVEVWSELTDGNPVNFSFDLAISNGSVIDFAIDPDGAGVLNPIDPLTLNSIADGSDGTTFQFDPGSRCNSCRFRTLQLSCWPVWDCSAWPACGDAGSKQKQLKTDQRPIFGHKGRSFFHFCVS